MIILPVPFAFQPSAPTRRRYSLVCQTADGRPVYIALYGRPGLGREALAAAKSVLRPSVEVVWDMEDEREPVGWTLAWCALGTFAIGLAGVVVMIIADLGGFLPKGYFLWGGWGTVWTRVCLCLLPIVVCGALIHRRLNRPGP
jgi:hypothetical protein